MRLRRALAWLALAAVAGAACQLGGQAGSNGDRTASSAATASGSRDGSSPARGGTFTEAVIGSAGSLNPLFADEDNARDINSLIYQGLTRIGADQKVEPLLAREIRQSANGLLYSILLRSDVRWADGAPFSADDVVFTFSVLQDPSYDRPAGAVWKGVTVRKVSAEQVDFALKAPSAAFPVLLRIGIIPAHVFAGDAARIAASPFSASRAFGTGPFQVEWVSADRSVVTLRRNPNARPVAQLDRIVFKGYGDLDQAVTAVSRAEADGIGGLPAQGLLRSLRKGNIAVLEAQTFSFAAIFLDLSRPFFFNPSVRRALSQAIDRQAIVSEVLGGRADSQATALPPSSWAYSGEAANRVGHDPAAAARALDEAGWIMPEQGLYRSRAGREFRVTLVAADVFPQREVARLVRRQLAAIGVGVQVEIVPVGQLITRYLGGRTYQMALANLDNGPDPDQYSFWHSSQREYPLNFSSLPRQSFVDKDLEDGRARSDREARRATYADLQNLLVDATPALFLYEPHYQYAVNRRFSGIRLDRAIEPVDRFANVTDWHLAQ